MSDEAKSYELYDLCSNLDPNQFKKIQEWLDNNKDNQDLLKQAANYKDEDNRKPLHILLRYKPPSDLVEQFLDLAPKTIEEKDNHGELPLHIALRYEASYDVIKMLLQAYPKASEVVINMLLQAYPQAIKVQNNKGWLPLHIALYHNASSDVVEILLGAYPQALKTADFSLIENNLFCDQYRRSIPNRLQRYLDQQPEATCNFYCLLQGLPYDEQRKAVLHNYVQTKIKEEFGCRLNTFMLLFDFYIILAVVCCFVIAVTRYNKWLFGDGDNPNLVGLLSIVISGGIYFFIRELIQAYSFYRIGYYMTWLKDPTHPNDIVCIVIMILFPSIMLKVAVNNNSDSSIKEVFRSLSALASGMLYFQLLSFWGQIFPLFLFIWQMLGLAINQLFGFLMVLITFINAFALMFYVMFIGSSDCSQFCSLSDSWFEVYNMILGNYGPDDLFGINTYNLNATIDYNSTQQNKTILIQPSYSVENYLSKSVIYMLYFLLGILGFLVLLNILIAVVIDAYKYAKKSTTYKGARLIRRLKITTENVVLKRFLQQDINADTAEEKHTLSYVWKSVTRVFSDKRSIAEREEEQEFSSKVYCYLVQRIFAFLFLFIWLLLGAVTAGLLWPSEVRKWLWDSSDEEDSQKMTVKFQSKNAQMIKEMKAEIIQEMKATMIDERNEMIKSIKKLLEEKFPQTAASMNVPAEDFAARHQSTPTNII